MFVFGLATYTYALADEAGRRLAAVQLVKTKIASAKEVASAFGVSGVTLWTWRRDYTAGGVAGLVRARTGPKGPIKLTETLTARIIELEAAGLTLLKIVSHRGFDRTVRVALGRVATPSTPAAQPAAASEVEVTDTDTDTDDVTVTVTVTSWAEDLSELGGTDETDAELEELVAARFGDLVEARC